jgi:hypothetical protein
MCSTRASQSAQAAHPAVDDAVLLLPSPCRSDLGGDERSETTQYALQQLLGLAGVLKVGSARYLWLQPLGHLCILLS